MLMKFNVILRTFVGSRGLNVCRDAVGAFYNPSKLCSMTDYISDYWFKILVNIIKGESTFDLQVEQGDSTTFCDRSKHYNQCLSL